MSRERRKKILQCYNNKCKNCGITENLQIDHIIPFFVNQDDRDENLQVLCRKCHYEKHHFKIDWFFDIQDIANPKFNELQKMSEERVDFTDVMILMRIFKYDMINFPTLAKEIKWSITDEALRKRVNKLIYKGYIGKIERSNPTILIMPKDRKEEIKKFILNFFELNSLKKIIFD
ncbi:MAG: HNH endonuclease signature motif containing protein [Nanoarchaeota archaeon]